jgi:hypothetical protein
VNQFDACKLIEEKLAAASGKPVLLQRDPNCSGHASIKIASDDDAAHVLRYKPELESELPYLSAFQCGLALRSIQAKTVMRRSSVPKPQPSRDELSECRRHNDGDARGSIESRNESQTHGLRK